MSILDAIQRWMKWFEPSPRYKIIHDPQFGYKPIYRDDDGAAYYRWKKVDHRGQAYIDDNFPSSFAPTIEEAGRWINLHATNRGQSVVWQEGQP